MLLKVAPRWGPTICERKMNPMPGIVLLLPVESLPQTGTSGRAAARAAIRDSSASGRSSSSPVRNGRKEYGRPLFTALMKCANRRMSSTERLMLSYML
jgi:hypothetical protein